MEIIEIFVLCIGPYMNLLYRLRICDHVRFGIPALVKSDLVNEFLTALETTAASILKTHTDLLRSCCT